MEDRTPAGARAIFTREYLGSRNMMTPTALAYFRLANGAVELSQGTGFYRDTIYGVTVVRQAPNGETHRDQESSGVFYSRAAAEIRIAELQRIAASYEEEDASTPGHPDNPRANYDADQTEDRNF